MSKTWDYLKLRVNHESVALDLIRVFLGVALFIRGVLFITNQEPVLRLIEQSGFDWALPVIVVHYVALSHLVGGFMMAVGLLTRWAALVQIPILVGAVFIVNMQEGFSGPGQSLELSVLVLFLLVIFFAYGSGRLSMNYFLFERPVVPDAIRTHAELESVSERAQRAPASMTVGPREHVQKYPGVCSCGHGVDDFWVEPQPVYSKTAASVGVVFGIAGGKPTSVVYRCRKCDEIVAETTDPQVLAEFTK